MSVPTESITKGRLKGWARRLAQEHATPIVLVGVGHDEKQGQLVVLTVEDMDDEMLAGSLAFALEQLKPGMVRKAPR